MTGPGALDFLQRLTTNQLDKPVGSVTYTLLLDETGGVRSDLTVARLAHEQFQVGANGNLDLDWLGTSVRLPGRRRRCTSGTSPPAPAASASGARGPANWCSRSPTRTSRTRRFGYFRAKQAYLGHVPGHRDAPVVRRRTRLGALHHRRPGRASCGTRCGRPGRSTGVIAAGRSAFNSLRLEKGYRSWGTDMTAEHNPYEAGLGFAVRMDKGDFVGREALRGRGDRRPAG